MRFKYFKNLSICNFVDDHFPWSQVNQHGWVFLKTPFFFFLHAGDQRELLAAYVDLKGVPVAPTGVLNATS